MLVDKTLVGFARTRRLLSNLEISRKKKKKFGSERCRCAVAGFYFFFFLVQAD